MPAASPGYDAALTPTGDLSLTAGVVSGPAFTLQRLRRRIATHLGEYVANRYAGIDWQAVIQTQPVNLPLVIGVVRQQIDTCPGIRRTVSLDATFVPSTRTIQVVGSAELETGGVVSLDLNLNALNGNPALAITWLSPQAFLA